MYPIDKEFAHATIETELDENGREYYAAACDNNAIAEVEFIPYPDEPAMGIIRAWYNPGYGPDNMGAEGGQQAGLEWAASYFYVFREIVAAEWSIENALENYLISKQGNGRPIVRDPR